MIFKKLVLLFTVVIMTFATASGGNKQIVIAGGPCGGVFVFYANAMTNLLLNSGTKATMEATHGSTDNIRMVNSGKADFGIAYSRDLMKAENGLLEGDKTKYTNVSAVGYLYSAPAQLAVRADSNIKTINDLAGKRVAIGPIGSGAAANAEEILKAAGLSSKIKKYFIGYMNSVDAFNNNMLDAVWIFSGVPNPTIEGLARANKIRLINIPALVKGVPDYCIKKNSYPWLSRNIATVADYTLLITGKNTPPVHIEKLMKDLYSKKGYSYMKSQELKMCPLSRKTATQGTKGMLNTTASGFWADFSK